MKGLIFINKIKLKIDNYLKYLSLYNTENAILFLIVNIMLFASIYFYGRALEGSLFCLLFLPIFSVHLITEKNKINSILSENDINTSRKIFKTLTSMKYYLIKYLKFYLVFLLIFTILYLCSFLSSIISLFVLMDSSKSLGQSVLLMLSIFFTIEGFYTLLSTVSIFLCIEKDNFNPFKAVFIGKKRMKKQMLNHFLSILSFSLITLPLLLIGDLISSHPYLSALFITCYIMLIFNFAIFDLKQRFEDDKELLENKKVKPKNKKEKLKDKKEMKSK